MRFGRFPLFSPPLVAKLRRGETEYAIGAIPLGGYVRITGMNPAEDIPPEVLHRAYFRQPVWKRVVVIGAGPAVNIALAFVILWVLYVSLGTTGPPLNVGRLEKGTPAAKVLHTGDAIVAVNGRAPAGNDINAIATDIGRRIDASKGAPVTLRIRRDGRTESVTAKPFY